MFVWLAVCSQVDCSCLRMFVCVCLFVGSLNCVIVDLLVNVFFLHMCYCAIVCLCLFVWLVSCVFVCSCGWLVGLLIVCLLVCACV